MSRIWLQGKVEEEKKIVLHFRERKPSLGGKSTIFVDKRGIDRERETDKQRNLRTLDISQG